MNDKTRKKLLEINLEVVKKHRHEMIVSEKPWQFETDIVKDVLPKASPKERYMLEKAMEHPMMRDKLNKVVKTINPVFADKVTKEVDYKIKEAIKKGELPDPKKDKEYHHFLKSKGL